MKEEIKKAELMEWLMAERNYHSLHPHEVMSKLLYSIGGTMATIVVAFLAKYSDAKELNEAMAESSGSFIFYGVLMIAGYLLLFYGVAEHSDLHNRQRLNIENAINHLMRTSLESFDPTLFWKEFGISRIRLFDKFDLPACSLLSAEPDTRNFFKFHDRKIEVGALLIFAAIIMILCELFL